MRQKPVEQLENPRGGRTYGVAYAVPGDGEWPAAPALPREVAEPGSVWVPPVVLEGFRWREAEANPWPAGMEKAEWEARLHLAARAEVRAIGSRAREVAGRAWDEWWASEPSLMCRKPEFQEAIRWWIICVFQRVLFDGLATAMPLVPGSMGNWVRNPLAARVQELNKEIRAAEDRFGMNLKAQYSMHLHQVETERQEDEFEKALKGG